MSLGAEGAASRPLPSSPPSPPPRGTRPGAGVGVRVGVLAAPAERGETRTHLPGGGGRSWLARGHAGVSARGPGAQGRGRSLGRAAAAAAQSDSFTGGKPPSRPPSRRIPPSTAAFRPRLARPGTVYAVCAAPPAPRGGHTAEPRRYSGD